MTKLTTAQKLNFDPSLEGVVQGKSFYNDLVAWQAETMDDLKESVTMVNAIWEFRGYRTPTRYCSCGATLDDSGECPRAVELDASLAAEAGDGDTERIEPLGALVDQPSFPHDEARATFYRQIINDGVTEKALVDDYSFKFKVGKKFARAAVHHILAGEG